MMSVIHKYIFWDRLAFKISDELTQGGGFLIPILYKQTYIILNRVKKTQVCDMFKPST